MRRKQKMDRYNACVYLSGSKWMPGQRNTGAEQKKKPVAKDGAALLLQKVPADRRSQNSRKTAIMSVQTKPSNPNLSLGNLAATRSPHQQASPHDLSPKTPNAHSTNSTHLTSEETEIDEWKQLDEAEFEEVAATLSNRDPFSIVSFGESKFKRIIASRCHIMYYFHSKFLSRAYPGGVRVQSSNLCPMEPWAVGCQMVALNYQTLDKQTLKNEGRFRYTNGGCGYVLKPKLLREELSHSRFTTSVPISLQIKILSGHGLPRPQREESGQI